MSKIITLQICGIVLDELYHNATKSSVDQISTELIANSSGISEVIVNLHPELIIFSLVL